MSLSFSKRAWPTPPSAPHPKSAIPWQDDEPEVLDFLRDLELENSVSNVFDNCATTIVIPKKHRGKSKKPSKKGTPLNDTTLSNSQPTVNNKSKNSKKEHHRKSLSLKQEPTQSASDQLPSNDSLKHLKVNSLTNDFSEEDYEKHKSKNRKSSSEKTSRHSHHRHHHSKASKAKTNDESLSCSSSISEDQSSEKIKHHHSKKRENTSKSTSRNDLNLLDKSSSSCTKQQIPERGFDEKSSNNVQSTKNSAKEENNKKSNLMSFRERLGVIVDNFFQRTQPEIKDTNSDKINEMNSRIGIKPKSSKSEFQKDFSSMTVSTQNPISKQKNEFQEKVKDTFTNSSVIKCRFDPLFDPPFLLYMTPTMQRQNEQKNGFTESQNLSEEKSKATRKPHQNCRPNCSIGIIQWEGNVPISPPLDFTKVSFPKNDFVFLNRYLLNERQMLSSQKLEIPKESDHM